MGADMVGKRAVRVIPQGCEANMPSPTCRDGDQRRRPSLALQALLLIAAVGLARGDNGRELLQQKPFPFCRCTDYKCSSSPYTLRVESQLVPTPTGIVTVVTMIIASNTNTTVSECFGRLQSSVQRVALLTNPSCAKSWSNVMVNGAPVARPAPIFKTYSALAELKITFTPRLSSANAVGTVISFTLSGACPDLTTFINGQEQITYSFGESNANTCCPVCASTARVPDPSRLSPPPSPPGVERDPSWDFRGQRSKAGAVGKYVRQGGVGYGADGNPNGPKLRRMYNDWCLTFPVECAPPTSFSNFVRAMKVVDDVNKDPSIPWWASGNAFSGLDEATFQDLYTGQYPEPDNGVARPPETLPGRRLQQRVKTSPPPRPPPRPPPPSPSSAPTPAPTVTGGVCHLYDSSIRVIYPDPIVSNCQACYNACYANQLCWSYNWNDGPRSAYNDLGACNNASPPPNPPPPPRPPQPPPVNGINWASRGMVSNVRNQGGCGACWAFTAVAAIESLYLMSGKGLNTELDLSEQQLVSCYPTPGCDGGNTNYAMTMVVANPLDKESLWPYAGVTGTCTSSKIASATSGNAVQMTSTVLVPPNNETAFKNALVNGPATIVFMVDSSFQAYAGGVYASSTCTTAYNHGMLAVGWDYDPVSNSNYVLIKNSWGTGWGEAGYSRVKMIGDGPGQCALYVDTWQAVGPFTSTDLSSPFNG